MRGYGSQREEQYLRSINHACMMIESTERMRDVFLPYMDVRRFIPTSRINSCFYRGETGGTFEGNTNKAFTEARIHSE